MRRFICGKFMDTYLLADRSQLVGVRIGKNRYEDLRCLSETDDEAPSWFVKVLVQLGYTESFKERVRDIVLIRKPTSFNFGRASYGYLLSSRRVQKILSASPPYRVTISISNTEIEKVCLSANPQFILKALYESREFKHEKNGDSLEYFFKR